MVIGTERIRAKIADTKIEELVEIQAYQAYSDGSIPFSMDTRRKMKSKSTTARDLQDEWGTPPDVVRDIAAIGMEYFSGSIVDVCCTVDNAKFKPHLGSVEELRMDDCIFMNPPFSKADEMFRTRISNHCCWIVVYRTDNLCGKVWQTLRSKGASTILHPRRRMAFIHPITGKPVGQVMFPSAIITSLRLEQLPADLSAKYDLFFLS